MIIINLYFREVKELKESGKTQIWWYCDSKIYILFIETKYFIKIFQDCSKGIQELQPHFDCLECEDYTLCKKCYEDVEHEHKLRKGIVPEGCIVR